MDKLLAGLNEAQREAVTTTEGYVRVVAGAGSGKTRALTRRFLYLAEILGVSTRNILCATFSNKAAGEMKSRIRALLPDRDLGMITTFHGFCSVFLKEESHVLHYPSAFIVLDDEDKETILKDIFSDMGLTSRDLTVNDAIEYISRHKGNRRYVPTLTGMDAARFNLLESRATNTLDRVLYRFFWAQRKCYGLDFDDLIYFTLHILTTDPPTLEKWQERMEYVMVDEFQDIDRDQLDLAELLAGKHGNLFVVGDPDQTIYTWRGAEVRFILEFAARHPGCRTVMQNLNYRSTPQIVAAASHLVERNSDRLEKTLTAVRPEGAKPLFFYGDTPAQEAQWIADGIAVQIASGVSPNRIAVLYRAHHSSRSVEEALIRAKIPYVLWGGVEFYRRKEIKDALCYLRMLTASDDLAFTRTVNEPRRGIGRTRMERLRQLAADENITLYEALVESLDTELFSGTKAREYVRLVEKYRVKMQSMGLADLLTALLNESGYEETLRVAGDEERLDNLAEFKQSVYEYESGAGEEVTLSGYLAAAALFTDMDREERAASVKLMTVHAAKGLEFSSVYICAMNENTFPTRRADTPEKLEEERRLAFVAMTRAMDTLFISASAGGGARSEDGSLAPSRFVFEMGRENVELVREVDEAMWAVGEARVNANSGGSAFSVGDRVNHPVFGDGEVTALTEEGSCRVKFDSLPTARTINASVLRPVDNT